MKHLQILFSSTTNLLIVLTLVIATLLLVGQQTLAGLRNKAADPSDKQAVEVVTFQSPLPTATPTPPSPPAPPLKVVAVEPVKNGPYRNIIWSPDGTKALISKQYTQYLLLREKGAPPEGLPPGVALGTTVGLGDLWLLDLTTGQERQLATKVGRYVWSPDSTQVAYLAPTGAEGIAGAVYVLDIASGNTKRMAAVDFLGSDYAPHWLPTDDIVYVRDGQLRAIQARGNQEKVLPGFRFFNRLAAEAGKSTYLSDPDAPIGFHFSPDGRRVAYLTRHPVKYAIGHRLWLADADGNNAKLITEQSQGGYYEWSPDGEWLVFDTFRDVDDSTVEQHHPGLSGLWAIRADGSEVHPLYRTDGWRWILSPAWSPDSSMVVFVEYLIVEKPDSPKAVFWEGSLQVANVERGEAIPLKGLPENEEAPARVWWSPDGQHLFIFKDGGAPELYQSYRLTLATE